MHNYCDICKNLANCRDYADWKHHPDNSDIVFDNKCEGFVCKYCNNKLYGHTGDECECGASYDEL